MLIKYAKLFPDAMAPVRASSGAVGFDVYAYHIVDKNTRKECGELPATIMPGKSILLGTGITFAVPFPIDCEIRPRSGLASKYDIELSNSPGTIDPDYRGEAGILLRNRGTVQFIVEKGMRVAQLLFKKAEIPHFMLVEALPPTIRNTGGFGSTGMGEILLGDEEYMAEQKKWDRYFMKAAIAASELSDCLRGADKCDGKYIRDAEGRYRGAIRRFGCVIVKDRNTISQGFNHRNMECSEAEGCLREREGLKSGRSNDDGCLHAEEAAIQNHANSGGPSLQGTSLYVNAEPCKKCAKFISGCGISAVIVPLGVYPTNGLPLLMEAGIEVRNV